VKQERRRRIWKLGLAIVKKKHTHTKPLFWCICLPALKLLEGLEGFVTLKVFRYSCGQLYALIAQIDILTLSISIFIGNMESQQHYNLNDEEKNFYFSINVKFLMLLTCQKIAAA